MDREVDDLLAGAGEAATWRRICAELAGEPRVALASADPGLAARLVEGLKPPKKGKKKAAPPTFLTLDLGGDPTDLGTQDRVLGAHALLWATPIGAPMGAGERAALAALRDLGAPTRAAAVLADWDLLARLSDDPEAEGAEVIARARELLPEGWELLRPDELGPWLDAVSRDRQALAADQRGRVASLLLADAARRAAAAVDRARAELAEVEALLARQDDELAEIRARGQRAATHLLAAVTRRTRELQGELHVFLGELEAALPNEVAAIDDLDQLGRILPHWLQHVVERWLGDRLATWRADVAADLADLPLEPDDLRRAELLAPSVHPGPIARDPDWTTRLGATAALGGGVALLVLGLWAPALVAVGGGLGWSALRSAAREASTREALSRSATEAVQRLGPELVRVLDDQLATARDALSGLGDERAAVHREALRETRARIEADLASRRSRTELDQRAHDDLVARIDAIQRRRPPPPSVAGAA